MRKKKSDDLRDRLFTLADAVIDEAEQSKSAQFKLDALKVLTTLYVGDVRANKNEVVEDENVVTFDSIRKRIEGEV